MLKCNLFTLTFIVLGTDDTDSFSALIVVSIRANDVNNFENPLTASLTRWVTGILLLHLAFAHKSTSIEILLRKLDLLSRVIINIIIWDRCSIIWRHIQHGGIVSAVVLTHVQLWIQNWVFLWVALSGDVKSALLLNLLLGHLYTICWRRRIRVICCCFSYETTLNVIIALKFSVSIGAWLTKIHLSWVLHCHYLAIVSRLDIFQWTLWLQMWLIVISINFCRLLVLLLFWWFLEVCGFFGLVSFVIYSSDIWTHSCFWLVFRWKFRHSLSLWFLFNRLRGLWRLIFCLRILICLIFRLLHSFW